jgi:DNA topoisomerase-1
MAATRAPTNITTDIDCDECGKPMIIRNGKRGKFLGCSGYPKCKNTAEVPARLVEEMEQNAKPESNGHPATNGAAPKGKKGKAKVEEIETDLEVD